MKTLVPIINLVLPDYVEPKLVRLGIGNAFVYYFRVYSAEKELFKIGITYTGLMKRLHSIFPKRDYKAELIGYSYFSDSLLGLQCEKSLHKYFEDSKYQGGVYCNRDVLESGGTELYHRDVCGSLTLPDRTESLNIQSCHLYKADFRLPRGRTSAAVTRRASPNG